MNKGNIKGIGAGIIVVLAAIFAIGSASLLMAEKTPTEQAEIPEDEATYKYFAGLKLKEVITDDTYMLMDGKEVRLYINEKAINEDLDKNLPNKITKDEALKMSEELCGKGYTLQHIVENPTNFDILYKKYINKVEIFGGDCYMVVNGKTGKIGAYKKIIFDIPKLEKPKLSKEVIEDKTGVEVNLVVIPHINKLVWMTEEYSTKLFDANTGKEIDKIEGKKIMDGVMRTDKGIGNLKKESTNGGYGTRTANNDEGAVFRDDIPGCYDNINNAEASMEKDRPFGGDPWDHIVSDYDDNADEDDINYILDYFEGVYYSGHGTHNCIYMDNSQDYCWNEIDSGLQTKLFVVAACLAGGNYFGTIVEEKGVECVIGASGSIYDTNNACGIWADKYWDFATGNEDSVIQYSAGFSRALANIVTPLNYCNLNTEKGNCGVYI